MPRDSRYLYSVVVRNSDNLFLEESRDMNRTQTVEYLRSFLRSMDEDEYTLQIDKKLKW